MKKMLFTAAFVFLMLTSMLASKPDKHAFCTPHPGTEQYYTDLNGNRADKGPGVGQSDTQSDVIAMMVPYSDKVNRITVSIFNKSGRTILFTPSTAFVTLPNGHSYAPYTQTDAIEVLVNRESARANQNVGYNPPPDILKTNCTSNGSTTNCTSMIDSSKRAAYDAGYGIGSAISNIIAARHLNKQVKDLQELYLTSREIESSTELAGYLDVYVEDLEGGPFKLTLPVDSKTYTFVFGPDGFNVDLNSANGK